MLEKLRKIFSPKPAVEEVKEQIKEKTIKEKFNEYCELNPDADECREYDV